MVSRCKEKESERRAIRSNIRLRRANRSEGGGKKAGGSEDTETGGKDKPTNCKGRKNKRNDFLPSKFEGCLLRETRKNISPRDERRHPSSNGHVSDFIPTTLSSQMTIIHATRAFVLQAHIFSCFVTKKCLPGGRTGRQLTRKLRNPEGCT